MVLVNSWVDQRYVSKSAIMGLTQKPVDVLSTIKIIAYHIDKIAAFPIKFLKRKDRTNHRYAFDELTIQRKVPQEFRAVLGSKAHCYV